MSFIACMILHFAVGKVTYAAGKQTPESSRHLHPNLADPHADGGRPFRHVAVSILNSLTLIVPTEAIPQR